jgi:hypothetical protein
MDWFPFATLRPLRKPVGIALLALLAGLAPRALAQYEIKSGVFNQLSGRVPASNSTGKPPVGTDAAPTGTPTTTPQYANIVESTAASTGSLSGGVFTAPNSILYNGGTANGGVTLSKSSVGTTFASGVPRYFLGDVISPPTVIYNSSGQASTKAASYWRAAPLAPGETFPNSPKDYRDGTTVLTGSLATGVYTPYYYSPHAKLVFASTPGTVTVTWVSNVPDNGAYVFYRETFTVSSATLRPVRKMYWTERSYSGPLVSIPSGAIKIAAPVYSNTFPATVSTEVAVPGTSSSSASNQPEELRTFWYMSYTGYGNLHAYNATGRLLLEYLGEAKADGTRQFLGMDVVNVDASMSAEVNDVLLGEQILPFDGTNTDPDGTLVAQAPASASNQGSFYGQTPKGDGSFAYYAEKFNDIPESVTFYWLEPQTMGVKAADIGISSNADAAKTLIKWPKYLNQYTLSWPSSVSEYVHYTVANEGSSLLTGTGLRFLGGAVPALVSQDSAAFDLLATEQQLIVDLSSETELTSRALLKFSGTNGGVWYVRLLAQDMDAGGFREGDGDDATSGTVYVGERLTPPSSEYTNAAYIVEGKSYLPSAYIDPFTNGIPAAELGAVIPVNAVPGDEALTVWWFKKVPAKSSEFKDFYTPAKVARYTVAYRETSAPLVESFEQSTADDWTNTKLTSLVPPSASGLDSTRVLGPFSTYFVNGLANSVSSGPATEKTFYSGAIGSGSLSVSFRLYRFGTWNSEAFKVYFKSSSAFDFTTVLSTALSSAAEVTATTTGTVTVNGVQYDWSLKPVTGSYSDFATAGTSGVKDQIFNVTITATPTTQAGANSLAAFTFGVGSSLSSDSGSFAIDQVTLTGPLPTIVFASNEGSGPLSATVAKGSIYNQPNSALPGYNPNEEHALLVGGRAYALRDDLNIESGASFTSKSRVLIQYTDGLDKRPAVAVFKVQREDALHKFDYPVTAGTSLSALSPMPLPLLALPLRNGTCPNREVAPGSSSEDVDPATGTPARYDKFTFRDRKGYDWLYRGPHNPALKSSPELGMQFYYAMRSDFHIPGVATQPLAGTVLPYLPVVDAGVAVDTVLEGTPKTIIYRPVWPDFPPTLSVGETLTLSKSGLPAVRGQTSAEVLYQQSIALNGTAAASVKLVDSTRAKTVLLNATGVGLTSLPGSLKTTSDSGKTYFQLAQPHLQKRFYYSPLLGTAGGLVLEGSFVDEVAGEDYVFLNTLSADDVAALEGLVASTDTDLSKWKAAIAALSTTVQTYVESKTQPGTYVPDTGANVSVDGVTLPEITDSNQAVDSYALSALGKGAGYVTLVFGNGAAFTPQGEAVSMQVLKVIPSLYRGDLKAIFAANPLDEQTTVRHSGDFAAHPEMFDFEWRYNLSSTQPAVYTSRVDRVLGTSNNNLWQRLSTPPANPSVNAALVYSGTQSLLPASFSINTGTIDADMGLPGQILLNSGSLSFLNQIPSQIFFSATVGSADGFVLWVNNQPALAYNLPPGVSSPGGLSNSVASVGLVPDSDGLDKQFVVPTKYFNVGANRIEVALYAAEALSTSVSSVDFRMHASAKTDLVAASSSWVTSSQTLSNQIVLGGSATAPFPSNPLLLFSDAFFTMRYKAKAEVGLVTGTSDLSWSDWTEPVFVPSWVKRVFDGINPFNQRVTDLTNNPISTDVSVLTQAGKRWEGDVALSLSSISSFGLIEIYETVLNRVKGLSIDAGVSTDSVNTTLLFAAGYISDLYMILGNEAADDANNPTLQVSTTSAGESVSSARFSFEGQVGSLLEETLALWRGRDEISSATTTKVAPAYNRLYWNYTNGIRSGEPIYAVNYNILDASGAASNGIIDASDAQLAYPQGHGDAYGHYLTALKGYYKLATKEKFDWIPQAETASILGQSVQVDYKDERKFAAAAAALATAGYTVLDLTARKVFDDEDVSGWAAYDDETTGTSGRTRYWGTDDWAARAYQGSFFNWVNANAMIPVLDSVHEGVAKIDRTTVPELKQIAVTASSIFTLSNQLQAHINPLGIAKDSMVFDIAPAQVAAGKSHFEQIYERAVQAGVNAREAFARAGAMNTFLREQDDTLDNFKFSLLQKETAYDYQLTTIYGTPYPGDVGPGKLYAQGYTGPDLFHGFYLDKPSGLIDISGDVVNMEYREPHDFLDYGNVATWDVATGTNPITGRTIYGGADNWNFLNIFNRVTDGSQYTTKTFSISKFSLGQFVTSEMGKRQQVGKLQAALLDVYQAHVNLFNSISTFTGYKRQFTRDYELFSELAGNLDASVTDSRAALQQASLKAQKAAGLASQAGYTRIFAELSKDAAEAGAEYFPDENGTSNDVTGVGKAGVLAIGAAIKALITNEVVNLELQAKLADEAANDLRGDGSITLVEDQINATSRGFAAEFGHLYDALASTAYDMALRIAELQRAKEKVTAIYAEASRVIAERTEFRTRAAAVIQGYRTKDVVYRDLRSEQLAQYQSLFKLAQTYTYCAAKAYDYETGLLRSSSGRSFTNSIIGNLSLGAFAGQNPVSTKVGDPGLAGVLAAMRDDWAVVKGRLGLNNPDRNGTVFSLRQELFRIRTDQATADDDTRWKEVLQQRIMSNVLNDADVAANCANIGKFSGGLVPGIVIPFATTIEQGLNFFGWPYAAGDHTFSQSTFATKILSTGVVFKGYVGMDSFDSTSPLNAGSSGPLSSGSYALGATPYVYLIPAGIDWMRSPPLGDVNKLRSWRVKDQALPLPINIGATNYSALEVFTPQGTLNEQLWISRKHQAFRAVDVPNYFYGTVPAEFTSSRLVGRSVWNSRWKLVIPAYSLLNNEQVGLDNFIKSVSDIKLFLRTYSSSGN